MKSYAITVIRKLLIIVVMSFVIGSGVLATFLIPSEGLHPRSACSYEYKSSIVLYLPDPSTEGKEWNYWCNFNWSYGLFFIFYFGIPLSIILLTLLWAGRSLYRKIF